MKVYVVRHENDDERSADIVAACETLQGAQQAVNQVIVDNDLDIPTPITWVTSRGSGEWWSQTECDYWIITELDVLP